MTDRDVLWITLESVRYDHTSLSNYAYDTTPFLAQLASNGNTFDLCFSHDIWTRSSTASILSGQAPSAHQTWSNEAKLPEGITTIPEEFRDSGYQTVCITSNGQLGPSTGLDRGFDYFHYLPKSKSLLPKEAGLSAFIQWVMKIRQHSGGLTTDGGQHSVGYLNNKIGKKYIDKASETDDPLFLYLHHGDSHHPYVPPIAWRDHFAENLPIPIEDAVELALDMSRNLHEYIAQQEPFSDEEWQSLQMLYNASISYVDYLTGNLVRYAQQQLVDPIIVVTGDHGELFGECGLLAHMLIANTAVTNVPLVVSGLDNLPTSGLVQHSDIMKIICEDLKIDHPIPVGQDIRKQHRQFAVTQRGGVRAQNKLKKIKEYNTGFCEERFHSRDLTSIRTKEWRFQSSEDGEELFHLPDETSDVSKEYTDITRSFKDKKQKWAAKFGQPIGEVGIAEFDEKMKKQLRDLGYLQ